MIYIKMRYWPSVAYEVVETWIPSDRFVTEVECCIDNGWDYEVLEVSVNDYFRNNYGF